MSDLYRIHDEPEAVKRPDEGFYSEKGWLVPVEPVGAIEVYRINGKVNVEIDGAPDDGEYLIVKVDE